ncbi:phytanoyl-CoA dioxygenase family protein [Amphiplicatus metriothermophilus]|uniref:Ectoine hydroxylase-related dioxygenase, phytanoyl-CoA dioxygenase (PhyH) family n=1 Tax=Amphiplicatus metriothermophilus TaxID=1519374 RepID=A0A239PXB8_9PROT|nr:phytanoyl-CoA dioxygenase family protein [Amphiplicatus metriothermophilus]MBB5519919.1 ectoine hydroxylase-related dioxygenase (phytanoyl-CoA dioxygenase family) [Amphiplicatus metriothermophilus]SNT74820.1 Ectoine hydroxylase-related dioxygenase, phytanoyl-CoA dioxygenase (PhyH) family [Amphiplicatus metriothermophilus]
MTKRAPPRITDPDDLYQDLAGTYGLDDPALRGRVDPALVEADLAAIGRDGYVVIERLVGEEENAAARAALEALVGPMGRNDFEGFRTQRAYALLRKTRALDGLVAHPRILAILEAMTGPGPLLSACLAVRIHPGEKRQVPHFDAGFYPAPRPRQCHAVSAIWAIDPFTEENGGTVVWPGSHLWAEGRKPTGLDAHFAVEMPAGSVVVFHGDLWHAGGANASRAPRLAFTPQYCAQWLRTMENMSLAVPPSVVKDLSPDLQSLLGYQIRPPFMGYVDGMHPKRLLEGA